MDNVKNTVIEKTIINFAGAVVDRSAGDLISRLESAGYEINPKSIRTYYASLRAIKDNTPKSKNSITYKTLALLAKLVRIRPDLRDTFLGQPATPADTKKQELVPATAQVPAASEVNIKVSELPIKILHSQFEMADFVVIFGKKYKMAVIYPGKQGLVLEGDNAILTVPDGSILKNEEVLRDELLKIFENKIREIVPKIEKATGKHCNSWEIWSLKDVWGDCSPSRSIIRLSCNLVHLPVECLEETILHEVLHFFRKRHNKVFYRLMDHFMQGWRDADKQKRHFASLYLKRTRESEAENKTSVTISPLPVMLRPPVEQQRKKIVVVKKKKVAEGKHAIPVMTSVYRPTVPAEPKWADNEPVECDDELEAVPVQAATYAYQPVQYTYIPPAIDRYGNTIFFNAYSKPVQIVNRYGFVYNLMYLGSWNHAVDQCGTEYWLDDAGVIKYYRNINGVEGYAYA